MYKTLQSLQTLIDPATMDMSYADIAKDYGASLNPSLLALAFHKMYALYIQASRGYYGLTSEDIASFALQELDYSLQSYKPERNIPFTHYAVKVFTNRLREETISLSQPKRCANANCACFEELEEMLCYDEDSSYAEIEFLASLQQCNLTEAELTYCKGALSGYSSREIADELGVSMQRLCQLRARMRKKLSGLVYGCA